MSNRRDFLKKLGVAGAAIPAAVIAFPAVTPLPQEKVMEVIPRAELTSNFLPSPSMAEPIVGPSTEHNPEAWTESEMAIEMRRLTEELSHVRGRLATARRPYTPRLYA